MELRPSMEESQRSAGGHAQHKEPQGGADGAPRITTFFVHCITLRLKPVEAQESCAISTTMYHRHNSRPLLIKTSPCREGNANFQDRSAGVRIPSSTMGDDNLAQVAS